jgi:hypothetical protein
MLRLGELARILLELDQLERVLFGCLDPGLLDSFRLTNLLQIGFHDVGGVAMILVRQLASARVAHD